MPPYPLGRIETSGITATSWFTLCYAGVSAAEEPAAEKQHDQRPSPATWSKVDSLMSKAAPSYVDGGDRRCAVPHWIDGTKGQVTKQRRLLSFGRSG